MKHSVELANVSHNASAVVVEAGEKNLKDHILSTVIPASWARYHRECLLHIHDLEFYNTTYNCLGVSVKDLVGSGKMTFAKMLRKLSRKIVELTNLQSGGIGFIDFDGDAAQYITTERKDDIVDAIRELFMDLNEPTRKGTEKPYVTFNFGLDTSAKGRLVSEALLEAFLQGDDDGYPFIFPNLVFKVKSGINASDGDINYDVYLKANAVTARRMIPTYFNCDSPGCATVDPRRIGVMGCRTNVVENRYGVDGALQRGNVACVTMNLVRLAYLAQGNVDDFYQRLDELMRVSTQILLHRMKTLCAEGNFSGIYAGQYYLGSETKHAEVMLRNGTLSIGFIGLWDAISTLLDKKLVTEEDFLDNLSLAKAIVTRMRQFTDDAAQRHALNISLLASAAEGTTGRFAMYDQQVTQGKLVAAQKGFYTNSFHVPVDIGLDYMTKIDIESGFHSLCNGGAITYAELDEMPTRNVEAVTDIISYACQKGCRYVGVNFQLDTCLDCKFTGRMGSRCPKCGSTHIQRLRRVSGYLSKDTSFTAGKKAELKRRKPNYNVQ